MPENITLIPYAPEHLQETFRWIQEPELRRMFLLRGNVSWETHTDHFKKVLADDSQKVYALFADGRHFGNCGFKNIPPGGQEGELWLYIGEPSLRGKGLGKRATEMLVRKGFETLNFNKIYLHVADFNMPARNLYKALGFVEVPLRGNTMDWKDRGCTIIRMELTRD